jgi:hypothetical protein
MKHFVLVSSLLLPVPALATEFVEATVEAPATRWLEADSKSLGTTKTGQRLEVIYREGERLRVRLDGSTFAWIDAATTKPAESAGPIGMPAGLQLGGDGGLQLGGDMPLQLKLGE